MTDGENQRLGAYVETSVGGERVRAYLPAPLPPNPPRQLGTCSPYSKPIDSGSPA